MKMTGTMTADVTEAWFFLNHSHLYTHRLEMPARFCFFGVTHKKTTA